MDKKDLGSDKNELGRDKKDLGEDKNALGGIIVDWSEKEFNFS